MMRKFRDIAIMTSPRHHLRPWFLRNSSGILKPGDQGILFGTSPKESHPIRGFPSEKMLVFFEEVIPSIVFLSTEKT